MRTIIAAVIIYAVIEGGIAFVIEARRIRRVAADTRDALNERADMIDAMRERMVAGEHSARVSADWA